MEEALRNTSLGVCESRFCRENCKLTPLLLLPPLCGAPRLPHPRLWLPAQAPLFPVYLPLASVPEHTSVFSDAPSPQENRQWAGAQCVFTALSGALGPQRPEVLGSALSQCCPSARSAVTAIIGDAGVLYSVCVHLVFFFAFPFYTGGSTLETFLFPLLFCPLTLFWKSLGVSSPRWSHWFSRVQHH